VSNRNVHDYASLLLRLALFSELTNDVPEGNLFGGDLGLPDEDEDDDD
jgi:hypothetical protein